MLITALIICHEGYITEVEKALIYVRETPILSEQEKRRFFKSANLNLGVTALCLSGGAGFGYCTFTIQGDLSNVDINSDIQIILGW